MCLQGVYLDFLRGLAALAGFPISGKGAGMSALRVPRRPGAGLAECPSSPSISWLWVGWFTWGKFVAKLWVGGEVCGGCCAAHVFNIQDSVRMSTFNLRFSDILSVLILGVSPRGPLYRTR